MLSLKLIDQLNALSLEDIIDVKNIAVGRMTETFSNGMSFNNMLAYKKIISSQKFSSGWWDSQVAQIMGLQKLRRFDPFDMKELDADVFYESKYATESDNGEFSFPQIIRRNIIPNYYIVVLFGHDRFSVSKIPGDRMNGSIIDLASTPAHNSAPDERRINIKIDSDEMRFLLSFRDLELEKSFKNFNYIM